MSLLRPIIAELSRALAVLAFAALSFAHQPLAVERYGVSEAVTNAFICGSQLPGDPNGSRKTRTVCEACRVASVADLPEPPALLGPLLRVSEPRFVRQHAVSTPPSQPRSGGGPRAPPVVGFA